MQDRVPARPAALSPQDRRQSVIVLPFENSSGDPARDVADIIAEYRDLPLVPAATSSAYCGKARLFLNNDPPRIAWVGNRERA